RSEPEAPAAMGPQYPALPPERIRRRAVYDASATRAATLGLGAVAVACAGSGDPHAHLFRVGLRRMGAARPAYRPSLVAAAAARHARFCNLAGGIFRQPHRVAGTPLRAASRWPLRACLAHPLQFK